ncbi:MAG: carboxypeptidase-like regulatory domain-containing protein [Gemmatimonadetes bacterium]|nr:carboxypeptidase-like regulatory domain-containing protein [Gemmatimonadota bacterium]
MHVPALVRHAATAALLAASARSLAAQGTIRGVVNDSLLSAAPLSGAMVILQGAPNTAVTDRFGRFVMRDVPAGRYAIGFFHPVLDSLEATAPLGRVEVRDGETSVITLGMPSANTLSLALCGRESEQATSVVFGVVRDAERGEPLGGALVRTYWYQMALIAGVTRETQRVESDTADADGRYVICGVPNDISLTLASSIEEQVTGDLTLALDHLPIGRRDLIVSRSDTAARRPPPVASDDTVPRRRPPGSARLRLLVTTTQGRPVEGATVGVRETSANSTTDVAGRARLAGIPAGSQTLIVRKPGSEPVTRIVALRPGIDNELTVEIGRTITMLPTVAVTGQRRSQLESDITRRRMLGYGKFFNANQLEGATRGLAFWAMIPGVTLGMDGMDVLPLLRNSLGNPCQPNVWVDGALQNSVVAWELRTYLIGARWMEIYPSSANRPPEFTSSGDCGALVIWTG